MKFTNTKSVWLVCSTVLTILIATPTFAESDPADEAVLVCAEAVHGKSGLSNLAFVKRTRQSGFEKFSVWLNAEHTEKRGYCATKAGQVTELHILDGRWSNIDTFRPRALVLGS